MSEDKDREMLPEPLVDLEHKLESIQNEAQHIPTQERMEISERRGRRGAQVGVALSILIAIIALWLAYNNSTDVARVAATQELNKESLAALRDANKKLEARGLPPLPVPQQGETLDANTLSQAAAALVLAQINSDPTFRGPTGATGARGPSGRPCVPSIPECRGPSGTPGQPGQSGTPGQPGQDCDPAQIPECQGPGGQPGQPGADGAQGEKGEPGMGFDPQNLPHFEGNVDECFFVLTYVNPSVQDRIEVEGTAFEPCRSNPVDPTEPTQARILRR